MYKVYPVIIVAFFIIAMEGCSKKTLPSPAVINPEKKEKTDTVVVAKGDTTVALKKTDSVVTMKPVVKKMPKESIPRVIVVNDKYASKSVDGRYYYDLQGHRYWRNNKDGKYYLFNKSMLTDDAYKKPH